MVEMLYFPLITTEIFPDVEQRIVKKMSVKSKRLSCIEATISL